MKKILFLLLCTVTMYGQTYPTNPTTFGKISINMNVEDNTATKMSVQSSDNRINWLQPINIPIPYIPISYVPTAPTLGGHIAGIDNKLNTISATTAGQTTRVWFTADQTTITAGTFDLTNPTSKGTAPVHKQDVVNDDNQKKYFLTDVIGGAFLVDTMFPPGVYAGNLSASTTPNSAQQRWTVELYKCDNGGTPIASGVTGAVVGSLGVTVITILDSGLLTLADGSVTNVQVSGNLGGTGLSMLAGQRVRYHVSAEKVGTAASNITQSVYYGTSYNSFIDVTVPLNTNGITNGSLVAGATASDALNALNTGKTQILNDITELSAYTGTSKFVNVLDPVRGGNFYFVASGLTADNGVVFTHAISGYWARQLNGYVTPEFWGTGTTTSFSFIQSALNYAAGKNIKVKLEPKQYNIDDCLIIKSNTNLELDKATIIRLNDNVNKSMLRNFGAVYAGSTSLVDSNIIVSGGTWEGNGANQTLYSSAPSINVGIEFHNIENLRLRDLKINLVRSYAVYISSSKNVFIDRVNVDNGDVKDLNRDGLHFNGPCANTFINDCILRGTDDQLAFNANDIDYAYKVNAGGDITNTVVNNVIFDNTYKGIRLLSAANNITRITISNLSGTTSGNLIECGNYDLGAGGKIDDLQVSNVNVNVNQTINDGRVIVHFRKGGYGKIMFENIKIGGSHYVNPTFEFLNGVTMDYFKIKDFVSFGTDTGAYSDFKVRQGEATFPTISTFIIDGYSFTSPLKTGSLIDFNNLTSSNIQLLNCSIGATTTLATISSGVFGKFTLENNTNDNSTNGIQLTTTSIQELQLTGSYFKDAGGFSLSQDAASDIISFKANPYIVNNNTDVSSNSFVTYKNNGVTKTLQTVATATLQQVLTNGNTSTLGMSVKQVELGTGVSDTVPTLSWNYSGPFGWGMFEKLSDGNFKIAKKSSSVSADVLEISRSTGNFGIGIAPTTDKLTVNGNITATSYNGGATLTGNPTAPTATAGDNDTSIATTAFVTGAVSSSGALLTTTNQSWTGTKSFTGTQGMSFTKSIADNFATLTGTNNTTGSVLDITNSSSGFGSRYFVSSGTGIALYPVGSAKGLYGIADFGTSGRLIDLVVSGSGNGITVDVSDTSNANGLVINKGATGSGKPFQYNKSGVEKVSISDSGNLLAQTLILGTYTVATLPTPTTTTAYATVTDATAPTYLGALTGGGSVKCPVFYNGTAWVSH